MSKPKVVLWRPMYNKIGHDLLEQGGADVVVVDSSDYDRVLVALEDATQLGTLRRELALKVFQRTAAYDQAIARYLESQASEPSLDAISDIPAELALQYPRAKSLRYGENPHQKAALYGSFFDCFEQLQGKELSFNNIIDINFSIFQ